METTPNLDLPYLAAAQSQKHVTHNEALRALDAIVQIGVLSRDAAAPPASPAAGERHIVGAGATGAWAGRDGQLAAFQDGAWAFYGPQEGWLAWVAAEATLLVCSALGWTAVSSDGLNPAPLVGVNATADAVNRLAVSSPASLFDNVGNGHQLKINKAATSDTASLLMQTAYSGRAEMGLAGNDDFHFKVSADGATWKEAIVIDRVTGAVSFPETSIGGSQVNADWNATGGAAQILNKPALGTAAQHAASDFDAAGTASAAAAAAQTAAVQRANHTGSQPAGTITGLAAVATSGTFSDITGKPTTLAGYGITDALARAWASTAFATAIPLAGYQYMPRQIVSAPIAFSVAGTPEAGSQTYLRLIADGVNAPTFAGMRESGSSSGYNNTAGIDNQITFWHDGLDAWYSVSQEASAQPVPIPYFQSAQISAASPGVVAITMSRNLDAAVVPAPSAFAVSASGGAASVSSVAISGAVVSLTMSRSFAGTETVTVGYAQPATSKLIDSTDTWQAPDFAGRAVTNNVITSVALRLTTLAGALAESASATSGFYDYTATGSSGLDTNIGVSSTGLPAGADGYIEARPIKTANNECAFLCLRTSAANGGFSSSQYEFRVAGNNYECWSAGGGTFQTNAIAWQSGDTYRLRRASNTIVAEVRRSGSSTWNMVYTFASVSSAKLYGAVDAARVTSVQALASSNNWA